MKKKSIWIMTIIVILIIPVSVFYVLNNGNPYTKFIANKYVPIYLEEKGYSKEDLSESHYIEPKHTINNDFYHGHYLTIFKDEPEITYYYGIKKRGKQVKQFCEKDILSFDGVTDTIKIDTKHSEKDCVNSL